MNAVIITVTVDEKRQITIDVPQDIPVGTTLTLTLEAPSELKSINDVRALLTKAGKLAEADVAEEEENLSDEELVELGRLLPGAPSILDLVNEDRGASSHRLISPLAPG